MKDHQHKYEYCVMNVKKSVPEVGRFYQWNLTNNNCFTKKSLEHNSLDCE